ncbi:DUF6339 family protein [Myxococcus sp. RHSTA-1-4]|uniref:DUF6339 family protein n=1 Tax=Myxococcus sp. RHSTA-1-4 TaxID=2874601 RepID=UPI001CBCFEA2|nr:DUF6339 family protein [Myxococcus sp. RHSTA-1-4]MBZ4416007.1 hypothetical protein [Myxococcus sp. RHSTA-1-4]
MSRIHVLRKQTLDELENRVVSGEGIPRYLQPGPFDFLPEQLLEFPHEPQQDAPTLMLEDGRRGRASTDIENALKIYEWLGPMSETEARDERLWAWLAHVPFADYTRSRWPVPTDAKQARDSIFDHWFVYHEGRRSLRRHAIGRLWWAVHLTRAPWEYDDALAPLRKDDPYAYTRMLLGNQEVFFHTLEREFGSNRRILIALLEVIDRFRARRAPTPLVKWLAKEVNLACRYRELDLLPIEELLAFMEAMAALERESTAGT